ncbi:MAG: hypothetical protein HXX20_15385 [Chloroflexi bacterium]|nr:hypothetical protein [Chloroflexota bacterium]
MPPNDSEFILLAVDTSGIQSYIFGSNRLKENIGASYLVKQATEDWVFEALGTVAPKNNLDAGNGLDETKDIITHNLDAEVVYAGGGNFIALFREAEAARKFTRELSIRVLLEAPGLKLDVYQDKFEWTGTGLGEAVKTLLGNMKEARGKKPLSTPLLGLGVTVMCQSTAMPAVQIDEDERPVSAEIAAKLAAAGSANVRLKRELHPQDGYIYPLDLDDLGRSEGENSYIAVVHADGNGMGIIISEFGKETNNREYIRKMRQFSKQVNTISTQAMQKVIELLQQKIVTDNGIRKIQGSNSVADLGLKRKNGSYLLPMRPLVFGGDDTTFVCDGRVGLSLATTYLAAFEEAARDQGLTLSACAGISIVKAHYPFARAYQLAEELCAEAKKFRRENFSEGGGALDWYFSAGGLYDELEKMREREFTVKSGKLTMRSVSLGSEGKERTWGEIRRITQEFENDWADKRNKTKALRDVLREGPEAVERFCHIYGVDLPAYGAFSKTGWSKNRCGYFDALELMDIFIDLTQ